MNASVPLPQSGHLSLNVFSSCKVESDSWHRIEKDLYLGSSYVSSAYVHIQRKKEEELKPDDKVILDITVGRLDPSVGKKGEGDERWESKSEGIWIKRSAKRHASDEKMAVTGVDVLFGPDAVDPRENRDGRRRVLPPTHHARVQQPRVRLGAAAQPPT